MRAMVLAPDAALPVRNHLPQGKTAIGESESPHHSSAVHLAPRAVVVGWGDAALAQQIARPNLCVDNYSQGPVRDLFAGAASPTP